MLILISQLVGQPVITFDGAETIGVIRDPIIDPENGKLVGYFFAHGTFHLKHDMISVHDIVGYDQNRVVVQREDVAVVANEEPKIKKILAKKIPVLGAKVLTESGKYLGQANDLLFDTEMGMIVKYYVHHLLSDRIIAAEHVIMIDKRGIIVEDTATSLATAPAEVAN